MNSCRNFNLKNIFWRILKDTEAHWWCLRVVIAMLIQEHVLLGEIMTCKNKRNIFFFFCISCWFFHPIHKALTGQLFLRPQETDPDLFESLSIYTSAVTQTCEIVYERSSCEIKQTVSINPHKLDQWPEQTFWARPGGTVRWDQQLSGCKCGTWRQT